MTSPPKTSSDSGASPVLKDSQSQFVKMLRDGVAKGLWTVEDLDTPSLGYKDLCREIAHHKVVEFRSFTPPPYKNLLREAAAVSISDPRDFTPTAGQTPALEPPAPISAPSDDHRPTQDEEPLPF